MGLVIPGLRGSPSLPFSRLRMRTPCRIWKAGRRPPQCARAALPGARARPARTDTLHSAGFLKCATSRCDRPGQLTPVATLHCIVLRLADSPNLPAPGKALLHHRYHLRLHPVVSFHIAFPLAHPCQQCFPQRCCCNHRCFCRPASNCSSLPLPLQRCTNSPRCCASARYNIIILYAPKHFLFFFWEGGEPAARSHSTWAFTHHWPPR